MTWLSRKAKPWTGYWYACTDTLGSRERHSALFLHLFMGTESRLFTFKQILPASYIEKRDENYIETGVII